MILQLVLALALVLTLVIALNHTVIVVTECNVNFVIIITRVLVTI